MFFFNNYMSVNVKIKISGKIVSLPSAKPGFFLSLFPRNINLLFHFLAVDLKNCWYRFFTVGIKIILK